MSALAPAQTAANAHEAFERYAYAYEHDALIQSSWHSEVDGRQLACALGVLGPEVKGPEDCPAAVMPRWLARMTPWMFDHQEAADAKAWGLAFYAELKRLDGKAPFSVIHDWHATAVGPLAIETAEKRNRKPELHRALMDTHAKAAAGQKFTADEWRPVLTAAFFDVYANAYANAGAAAGAYAYSISYSIATELGAAYAASEDGDAGVDAYAYATAAERDSAGYKATIKRLAASMVAALSRVAA